MLVTVNGQPTDVPQGITVRDLIERLGLEKAVCAAELNKNLVPHREHRTQTLNEHDIIEIVTLVGGG